MHKLYRIYVLELHFTISPQQWVTVYDLYSNSHHKMSSEKSNISSIGDDGMKLQLQPIVFPITLLVLLRLCLKEICKIKLGDQSSYLQ